MKIIIFRLLILTVLILPLSSYTFAFGPDRRQDQFGTIPGYLIIPAPYVYPGLGKGWMLIGYGGNIMETNIDAYLIAITGDAEGYISSVEEIFVIPKYLFLSAMHLNIKKFGINMYSSRGMESEKDDFNIFVGDKYNLNKLETTLSLLERRIEVSLYMQNETGRTIEFRDAKGENPQSIPNPIVFKSRRNGTVLQLDWTDDIKDPREGFRLNSTADFIASVDTGSPEYNIISHGLTYYLPVFENSTWAFNYFRSDAFVKTEGNLNLKSILISSGLTESQADTCILYPTINGCAAQISKAQNTIKANKNGSALPLGGQDRLRSYPNGRYQAAHSQFYGTELRWNFNTSKEVVDLIVFSDVMEALQATFFWEQGSVSEEKSDLGKINRSSYGTGVRLIGGSGNVYRFEASSGNEGSEILLMFQYPWSGENG
ncbi:MAG: hypothetical protein H8E38_13495 [SAR324 cluster bacterium]|nr:hypothetical protein [SAR324 cluster bacterium]MBL7034642.1 hypothetical protein [SAR324 cluster bacterium]